MIHPYNPEKHRAMVEGWLSHYSIPMPPDEYLPKEGFMSDDKAVAFLAPISPGHCMIENVAGNPQADSRERSDAVAELFSYLEARAKFLGYKAVINLSANSQHQRRLINRGYVAQGTYTLYYKTLGD